MILESKRILIIKPSSLGDIIHTLPVVHALKRCFPGCHLGWIVQDVFAGLLERDRSVDAVYPIHISSTSDPHAGRFAYMQALKETMATLQLLRRILNQSPYDLVLDLHASFRSGLLGRTNPGGIRVGFKDARELNTFFQHQLVAVPEHVEHALEKNLLFCDHLNCSVADKDFYMCCNRDDVHDVELFFSKQGIADDSAIIYANPAARWQTKFWPMELWAELADCFYARGTAMVFGGSRQDTFYIQKITRLMKTPPVVAAGLFSLPQSVALLKRASLYVGLDSGPMHMAALCKIPVVALFGPTHPFRVGPYGVEHRIVRAENLDCLECRKRTCDHLSCMKGISVEMVYDAAISLMDRQT
jgi:ADP-heptose:LPS heptosyltransferase